MAEVTDLVDPAYTPDPSPGKDDVESMPESDSADSPVEVSVPVGIVHTFDPAYEAAKLREHLASLQPVVLLVGAGGSASVKKRDGSQLIPAVAGMTTRCAEAVEALGAWAGEFWGKLTAQLGALLEIEPSKVGIEDILTAVRSKVIALSEGDTTLGVNGAQLKMIEAKITEVIADIASPTDIPADIPHRALARWIGDVTRRRPVEIFTTNYDTLIERSLETERVSYFDGFVGAVLPFFQATAIGLGPDGPGRNWARVWKVHGSVNWELGEETDHSVRIVRREKVQKAHLILPSSLKYDQSRKLPYIALLDHFTALLSSDSSTLLVSIGFSFGDQHINDIVREALSGPNAPHLIALQHEDPEPESAIGKLALEHSNVIALGPNRAIIGKRYGSWALLDHVTDSTATDLDIVFDSDAVVGAEPELTGRFRLGDFAWFARFLDGIVAPRP